MVEGFVIILVASVFGRFYRLVKVVQGGAVQFQLQVVQAPQEILLGRGQVALPGSGVGIAQQRHIEVPEGHGRQRIQVGDADRNRRFLDETVHQEVLVAIPQGIGRIVPAGGQGELEERFQADIHVAVLEEFVVEVLFGEIGIQGQQAAELAGGIGQGGLALGIAGAVLADLLLGDIVILLGGARLSQHILHIGAVQIGFREVRIQFDGFVVVVQRIGPPAHLDKEGGSVVIGQHVPRVDVDDAVHIVQGVLEIPYLRPDEGPVVEGEGVARLVPEDPVQIGHRSVVILCLIIHQRPVEIRERIGRIQFDGVVHIGDGRLVILLLGIDAAAADIAFRLEPVQLDGLVVVVHRLERIAQEKIGSTAVQVGRRVLGFLADVAVEVFYRLVEALRQEVGHAAAVVDANLAGTQREGFFEVLEGFVILAETAAGDGPIVVAVGKYRIQPDRAVEVCTRPPQVAQVIFGDAAEEEGPIIGGVQAGQDVKLLNSIGILPFRQGAAAPEVEDIFVVLGEAEGPAQQQKQRNSDAFHK